VAAASAASEAGAGCVWLCEAGPGTADGLPLAGALAGTTGRIGLGLVADLDAGRHPSVLARDLTTLDVLSSGRAALRLRAAGPGGPDRLAQAGAVLARLFADQAEPVHLAQPDFSLAGARNRPPPVQPGGPPVLWDVDLGADHPARPAGGSPAGAVGRGPAGAVGRLRRWVGEDGLVLWAVEDGPGLAAEAAAARAGGADGIVLRPLGAPPRPGPVRDLVERAVELVGRWAA
jgi:hypothetical protein